MACVQRIGSLIIIQDGVFMYQISDLTVSIDLKDRSQIKRFEKYLSSEKKPEIIVKAKKTNWLFRENGNCIMSEDALWYKTRSGHTIELYENEKIIAQMKIDSDWTQAEIKYSKEADYAGYSICELLLSLIHRNLILNHNGLVLHSSAMKYKDMGIAFSAPSGTGKTTHTSLWEKHRSAEIINDDSPAIRMLEEGTFIYGTPWSGSSQKHTNDKLPLKAIVILEQAAANEMVQLSASQAVSLLMPRVFLPYQDEVLMAVAIDNISQLINRVPVYLLKCRADLEAMELVEKCLKL